MRLGSERFAPLAAALLLLGGGALARAAEPPAPTAPPSRDAIPVVRLSVEAPAGCAAREQVAARVAIRSPRIHLVAEGGAVTDPAAEVAIVATGEGGLTGELTVVLAGGRRSSRRVSARTCEDAVDALALLIAMIFDPTLAGARAAPAAGAPSAPSSSSSLTEPPRPPSSLRAPHAVAPPGRADAALVESTSSAAREVSLRGPAAPRLGPAAWRFGTGVAAQAITGPAPRLMPGLALHGEVARERGSLWSPALRLTLAHAAVDGLVEAGGTAAFALDAASLDLCPARLLLGRLEARGCAAGLVGRLRAAGSNSYAPRAETRPYATAGVALPLALSLGSRVAVEGRFGAGLSLVRDAFQFTPEVFHRVPWVALSFELGVGVRFP